MTFWYSKEPAEPVKPGKPKEDATGGYTKEYLEKLSLKELKAIGANFGTTDRNKEKLILEILKLQTKK